VKTKYKLFQGISDMGNSQKKKEPVKFEPDRGWSSYHENGEKKKLSEAKRKFEHKRNQQYKNGNRRIIKEEDERRSANIPERIAIYFERKFPHDWKKDANEYTIAVETLQRRKEALVSDRQDIAMVQDIKTRLIRKYEIELDSMEEWVGAEHFVQELVELMREESDKEYFYRLLMELRGVYKQYVKP
tara:strand:- start:48 stop:608 length:561 start_codon:yes stop_codon:yes gene_type:complete